MITGTTIYALIAAGTVTIGSLGYAAYEHQRAERYQVSEKAATDEATRLLVSVGSKDEVIGKLQGSLKTWQDTSKANSDAADQAKQRLVATEQLLTDKQQAIAKLREADNANPSCTKFLETDIGQHCAGRVAGMRQRSNDSVSRSPGGSSSAGRPEAGQQPH